MKKRKKLLIIIMIIVIAGLVGGRVISEANYGSLKQEPEINPTNEGNNENVAKDVTEKEEKEEEKEEAEAKAHADSKKNEKEANKSNGTFSAIDLTAEKAEQEADKDLQTVVSETRRLRVSIGFYQPVVHGVDIDYINAFRLSATYGDENVDLNACDISGSELSAINGVQDITLTVSCSEKGTTAVQTTVKVSLPTENTTKKATAQKSTNLTEEDVPTTGNVDSNKNDSNQEVVAFRCIVGGTVILFVKDGVKEDVYASSYVGVREGYPEGAIVDADNNGFTLAGRHFSAIAE